MYEPPIKMIIKKVSKEIANECNDAHEKNLMEALKQAEFVVDKEEVFKALNYDRDQYDKGFEDGFEEGKKAAAQYYLYEAYSRIIDVKEDIDDAVKKLKDIAKADGIKLE